MPPASTAFPVLCNLAAQHIAHAHKLRDERGAGLPINFFRLADLHDASLVHHDDDIGHTQRFFLIVRHVNRRDADAPLETANFQAQALPHFRVEIRQRFVEQQTRGRMMSARASATRCC